MDWCCGAVWFVAKMVFMRLIGFKNELVTKHSHHAFIVIMCLMNISAVFFLRVSYSRLMQPVEVYTNWYMMWYQK